MSTMLRRSQQPRSPFPLDYDQEIEEWNRQLQYNTANLQNRVCEDLEVVDACRGTTLQRAYTGKFEPYSGECEGKFYGGLPMYKSVDRNPPLYMYPLDMYPETWNSEELRGLIRWRIVSFKNFDDKTTCRRTEANIFQIEFASDKQPYNYHPTIFCFDEKADDFSGFKVSTIQILCNDIVVAGETPPSGGGGGGGGGDSNMGLIIGIVIGAIILLGGAFWYYKRQKSQSKPVLPQTKKDEKANLLDDQDTVKASAETEGGSRGSTAEGSYDDVKKEQSREAPADTKEPSTFLGGMLSKMSTHDSLQKSAHDPPEVKPEPIRNDSDHSDDDEKDGVAKVIPQEIKKMVSRLDNFIQRNFDGGEGDEPRRGRGRSLSPSPASRNAEKKNGRSRSLSPSGANKFADTKKPPKRSLSLERLQSSVFADKAKAFGERLSRSMHREDTDDKRSIASNSISSASRHKDRDLSRSKHKDSSIHRSKHDPLSRSKHNEKSMSRSKHEKSGRSLSRSKHGDRDASLSPSKHSDRDKSLTRSKHDSKHESRSMSRSKHEDRDRSLTRSKHDSKHESRSMSRSKHDSKHESRSLSRSKHDEKDKSMSRSGHRDKSLSRSKHESSKHEPLSRSKHGSKHEPLSRSKHDKDRSSSLTRSKHNDYADKGRSNSLSPKPSTSADRGRSLERKPSPAAPPAIGKGTALDASTAGRTITKNPDGSVLVTQKRKREDGATVVTKTRYATVALARKHGVDV